MKRALLCLLVSLLVSCSNTTGGALITLPFSVGGVEQPSAGPLTFSTLPGWTVTLEEARIALGAYYFNVSPPSGAAVRTGLIIVQVTHQALIDPLDPTLVDVSGGADGETGTAVAVEMQLLPPDASQPSEAAAIICPPANFTQANCPNEAFVQGTATKAGMTVPFAGFVNIDVSAATPQKPAEALQRVIGSFAPSLTFTAAPQQLSLRIDPRPWFDTADFATLLTSTPTNGRYTWDNKSTFHSQLLQGIQTLTGYNFALQPR
jgi:hypothetical protein